MFVDELTIKLIAGNGGDGCTSFRREKYVPMGGPDGGNGGRGSNIIFQVDKNLKTLVDLSYKKNIKGDKGVNGKGSNKYGANAEDVIIKIPAGTTITNLDTGEVLADLIREDESFIAALGGRGGRGNKAFATHDNPAPKFSEKGEPGEEKTIKLELKVLADVGLIGLPSVGKSTFLSMISSSKPKIAAYHFTTLSPNLGVVKLRDKRSFVIADLPGLIEGASKGVGLGIEFLRHAMRTRILAHVIDMGASEGRDPINDYKTIRNEIESYSELLANKKEIILANKMDIDGADKNLEKFKKEFPDLEIYETSFFYQEKLDKVIEVMADILDTIPSVDLYKVDNELEHKVYKFEADLPYKIEKLDDNNWQVSGTEIEKLVKMTRFEEREGALRFARKFKGMGIEKDLEELGAKPGDEIHILDQVFEFKE